MVGSKAIQASSADYSWNIFLALNEPYFFTKERAEKHIQRQLIATCIMNLEASTLKRSVKCVSTIFLVLFNSQLWISKSVKMSLRVK